MANIYVDSFRCIDGKEWRSSLSSPATVAVHRLDYTYTSFTEISLVRGPSAADAAESANKDKYAEQIENFSVGVALRVCLAQTFTVGVIEAPDAMHFQ